METASQAEQSPGRPGLKSVGRWALALFMAAAGIGHFVATESFLAQVPPWLPERRAIVYGSGVIEILFALALVGPANRRATVGWALAAFFIIIFPGNVSQAVTGDPAFGLDTPAGRWGRLLFQPVFIVWALWCTGAWRARRSAA